MSTIQLPDLSTIKLVSPSGETLLEDDILEINMLLTKAQKDVPREELSVSTVWVQDFANRIEEKYGCKLSKSHAWVLAHQASKALHELKKSCDPTVISSPTTSSTLTDNPSAPPS